MVLPGIGGMLGGEVELALELVGIGWSNTSNFVYHANAQVGDLAILLDQSFGAPASVTPSGFEKVGEGFNADGSDTRFIASVGVITTLTPPAGMAPSSSQAKAAIIVRPTRSINGLTLPAWVVNAAGFDNPAPAASGGGGVAGPLVVVGYTGSNGAAGATSQTQTPAHAYTEGYDPTASGIRGRVGVTIYNVTGVSHTVDIGDVNDANTVVAGYVVVT